MSQLREDTIGPPRSLVPVAAALVAAVIGILCYYLGSDRLDFAAHFVAGLGGTMLLLSLLTIKRVVPARGWSIVAVTAAAIGVGVFCESFFFVESGFDLVDVSNQSLGAVTAALIFATWPVRGARSLVPWLLLALALLGGGAKLVSMF